MKKLLSAEQSATLIAKGISADKASGQGEKIYKPVVLQNGSIKRVFDGYTPIFTLADICGLLPKTIGNFTLDISTLSDGTWSVAYHLYDNDDDWWSVVRDVQFVHVETELIDALYSLLCLVIEQNLLPK